MTVAEAIAAAEPILPGRAAPDDQRDPRWQAIIAVAEFLPTEPDAVWAWVARCGCSDDADLRIAIASSAASADRRRNDV